MCHKNAHNATTRTKHKDCVPPWQGGNTGAFCRQNCRSGLSVDTGAAKPLGTTEGRQ
jgi:hypothetical protein